MMKHIFDYLNEKFFSKACSFEGKEAPFEMQKQDLRTYTDGNCPASAVESLLGYSVRTTDGIIYPLMTSYVEMSSSFVLNFNSDAIRAYITREKFMGLLYRPCQKKAYSRAEWDANILLQKLGPNLNMGLIQFSMEELYALFDSKCKDKQFMYNVISPAICNINERFLKGEIMFNVNKKTLRSAIGRGGKVVGCYFYPEDSLTGYRIEKEFEENKARVKTLVYTEYDKLYHALLEYQIDRIKDKRMAYYLADELQRVLYFYRNRPEEIHSEFEYTLNNFYGINTRSFPELGELFAVKNRSEAEFFSRWKYRE